MQIAWVINGKEEALLYILNFGIFRKDQSQYMVLLQLKALENGVRFARYYRRIYRGLFKGSFADRS